MQYNMKYDKEQRLLIGRRIYEGEISRYQAAEEYGISDVTARDYMRLYRDVCGLPPKQCCSRGYYPGAEEADGSLGKLETMTREELICELVKARVAEARLKKVCEAKGDGAAVRCVSKNTRSF